MSFYNLAYNINYRNNIYSKNVNSVWCCAVHIQFCYNNTCHESTYTCSRTVSIHKNFRNL